MSEPFPSSQGGGSVHADHALSDDGQDDRLGEASGARHAESSQAVQATVSGTTSRSAPSHGGLSMRTGSSMPRNSARHPDLPVARKAAARQAHANYPLVMSREVMSGFDLIRGFTPASG